MREYRVGEQDVIRIHKTDKVSGGLCEPLFETAHLPEILVQGLHPKAGIFI